MTTETTWSTFTALPGAAVGGRNPAVAVSGGLPHIVWSTDGTLYHACLSENGWSGAQRMTAGSTPSLCASPDGRLHCLFANEFIGNTEVFYAAWDGSKWDYPVNVSRTRGASSQPVLAVAPDGRLYAAWADTTPGQSVIYYGRQEGAMWTSQPVPNAVGVAPSLGVDVGGRICLAWQDWLGDTQRYEVFFCDLENGAWTLPANLSASPAVHSIQPRLVLARDGGCHVVWQEECGAAYSVRYRSRQPGGEWSAVAALSPAGADCRTPQLVVNPQGFIEAVWLQDAAIMHCARPPHAGAAWRAPDSICGNNGPAGELSAGMGNDGVLHLVAGTTGQRGAGALYYLRRAPLFTHQHYLGLVFG